MKNLIKIFIFIIILSPSFSHSQELKICQEGIDKCKPLVGDGKKYSKCMRLMCYKYYSDEAKKDNDDAKYFFEYVDTEESRTSKIPKGKVAEELARSCEYGARKCESLSSNPEYYWECMTDSCKNPPAIINPTCDEGRNQCIDLQRTYNDCMKLTCGDQAATFETCPEAKSSCNTNHKSYWHCMYRVCLGPVDQYMTPATTKKFMIIRDKNGIKRRIQVNKIEPTISSAPSWAAKAPAGVDPEEWVRSMPQKFMITGNPSDYMQCIIPSAMISCSLNDIRSCRCSDGTIPLMLNGAPSARYDQN